MTTNHDLAERARALAAEPGRDRPACLCASVALATTRTIAAARDALTSWDGPAGIRSAALRVIEDLAAGGTAPDRCQCGHAASAHEMNQGGKRIWCSYFTAAGQCPCTTFQPSKE